MRKYLLLIPTLLLIANINGMEDINKNTINIGKTIKNYDISKDFKQYYTELNDKSIKKYKNLYEQKLSKINKEFKDYSAFLNNLADNFRSLVCSLVPEETYSFFTELLYNSGHLDRFYQKGYIISLNQLKNFMELFNSFDFTDRFDEEINNEKPDTIQKLDPSKIDDYLKDKKYRWVSLATVFEFLESSTKKLSNQTLLMIAQIILDGKSDHDIQENIQIIINKYNSILTKILKIIMKQYKYSHYTDIKEDDVFYSWWKYYYCKIQQLDKFVYLNSNMEKRFNNLHNKIIKNLQDVLENNNQNPQVDIQSKKTTHKEYKVIKSEWNVIKNVTNALTTHCNINSSNIPSANTLILKSPSRMHVKEYINSAIQIIQNMKTLIDNIIHGKNRINQYDLLYIMQYYFYNVYSLLLRLNIKELRQSIDFIKEFCKVYFDDTYDYIFCNAPSCLRQILQFDNLKPRGLEKNDYLYQWHLEYPKDKSPKEIFEEVLDKPSGNLSFGYDLNNLNWKIFDCETHTYKTVKELPIQ